MFLRPRSRGLLPDDHHRTVRLPVYYLWQCAQQSTQVQHARQFFCDRGNISPCLLGCPASRPWRPSHAEMQAWDQPSPKRYGGQVFRQETPAPVLGLIPVTHPESCRYRRSPTTKARLFGHLLRSECGQGGESLRGQPVLHSLGDAGFGRKHDHNSARNTSPDKARLKTCTRWRRAARLCRPMGITALDACHATPRLPAKGPVAAFNRTHRATGDGKPRPSNLPDADPQGGKHIPPVSPNPRSLVQHKAFSAR